MPKSAIDRTIKPTHCFHLTGMWWRSHQHSPRSNPKGGLTMPARTDRLMSAAVRAAKQAKQLATAAVREADRLLQEAKKRAETIERRRHLKKRLMQTARVMKSAGKAAVVAAVAAGVAAARAEMSDRKKLLKGGKR